MRGRALLVERVTIVGLGLMGGSLGMAIRRRHLAREVVGYSRTSKTLAQAKRRGAIDRGVADLRRAVQGAQLVVLATPVDTIVPLAQRLAPHLPAGGVITDVGSTKGQIVRALERSLPRTIAVVGAHPLAGSERQGIAAARATLFDGTACIVTATRRTNRRALRTVTRFWNAIAHRVVIMEPRRHDALLAATSHLPHLLAFALMGSTDDAALALAPRSFLDATRVAKSSPELWDDIMLSNRAAIVESMRRFDRQWRALRTWLMRGNRPALRALMTRAKAKRDALERHD